MALREVPADRVGEWRPVERYAESVLPTAHGEFRCVVYREGDHEHVVLAMGNIAGDGVLCRVHSACLTGEAFNSTKCDCRAQLEGALERIGQEGRGVLVYLQQEGRGIGLGDKIRAYALQEGRGLDTVDANRELGLPDDDREYRGAAAMLADQGVRSVRLMTNNPLKVAGLSEAGIPVDDRLPHLMDVDDRAAGYVRTKQRRMGHLGAIRALAADE